MTTVFPIRTCWSNSNFASGEPVLGFSLKHSRKCNANNYVMNAYSSSNIGHSRTSSGSSPAYAVRRVRLLYSCLALVLVLFGLRLFYVQIIQYTYYKDAALSDQLKQYQIPAERGIIEAHDGDTLVPIVLNQQLFTLYADPTFIKDPDGAAAKLAELTGAKAATYAALVRTPNTRYVVLAKKISNDVSDKILALKIPGVGTQGQDYRTYPQGNLAAQLLGFVDSDGQGQYGLEQAMNVELQGTPGQVKAVTDINGVPLAANRNNVEVAPVNGTTIVTTLDLSMQAQMERIVKQEYAATHSAGLSAIIMDVHTGRIKAMANYPTYDPANYQNVTNPALFQNAAAANAIEPGSTMKTLTVAAAIDQGVVNAATKFYDPAHWNIDDFTIKDIEEDGGAREQSISTLLSLSLNTGATWLLMQMSHPGGTTITQAGINAWRDYMTQHYRFGDSTGIQQGYESSGAVPPRDASAPGLTYATTTFGQGIQMTALQMAAAVSSVFNGGTYYQPTLIDKTISPDGTIHALAPKVLERGVVKPTTTAALLPLLENVVHVYYGEGFPYMNFPASYMVGGKTGTAQIAEPGGGYYPDRFNGTYAGFVGGDKPQYAIVVFNIEPQVNGYAGSHGGQPVFADLVHMLIDNSFVAPKT